MEFSLFYIDKMTIKDADVAINLAQKVRVLWRYILMTLFFFHQISLLISLSLIVSSRCNICHTSALVCLISVSLADNEIALFKFSFKFKWSSNFCHTTELVYMTFIHLISESYTNTEIGLAFDFTEPCQYWVCCSISILGLLSMKLSSFVPIFL